jgi:hypothetical protein
VFAYAGDPDAAHVVFNNVNGALPEIVRAGVRSPEGIRDGLKKVYRDKHAKHLRSLLGVHCGGHHIPVLLRTNSTKIVVGYSEYIGIGDSSALRYLTDFIFPPRLNVFEGQTLGSYLIYVANRYIDGCSGGPDHVILSSDGQFTSGSGGPWPNTEERFQYCEQQVGKALRQLLFAAGNGEVLVKP